MNRILIFVLSMVTFISCNKIEENTYEISGNIAGIEDGKQVYLHQQILNGRPVPVDTTEVKNEKFSFKGKVEEPRLHYLYVQDIQTALPFIVEEGNIEMEVYKDSIGLSKLSGTPSNDDLATYIANSANLRGKVKAIREQVEQAKQQRDEVTMTTLNETYAEIIEEGKNYDLDFIRSNLDSYMALLIMEQMLGTNSKTPAEISPLYDSLSVAVKETETGKALGTKLKEATRLTEGAIAPEFSGPTPDGGVIALKETLEKVTIVDFWAAWCKPCRVENPNLVALYNEYNDKGLNILGVSLDRKAEDWKKAIEEDSLTWSHVSNLQHWNDPIAKLYNIRSIPATYLLDSEGKIIAKDLRGQALYDKVAELLNK